MTIEIRLDHSIEVAGNTISGLTMRLPKVRDLKAARRCKGDSLDQDVLLYANLCEVEQKTIEELAIVDWDRLNEAYEELTPERPTLPELQTGMKIIARQFHQPFSEVENMTIEDFVDWLLEVKKEQEEGK